MENTVNGLAKSIISFTKYNKDGIPDDDDLRSTLKELCAETYLPDKWYEELEMEIYRLVGKSHE